MSARAAMRPDEQPKTKPDIFIELNLCRREIARQQGALAAATRAHADSLQKAERRKNDFLAMLAHELRNPLAPISNGLEILRLSAGRTGEIERVRGIMERQLRHMVRLIDDLLDMSRISQGKIALRREQVDLKEIVDSAIETSRPLIESQHHALAVDLPGAPLLLDADPTRLAQVVSNLLNNAAKYTPEGGQIRLSARAAANSVDISVSDTGIGIAEDRRAHIFEMFAAHAPDDPGGGLGVGLALVKHLVEIHGGTIEVESAGSGKGSTFTVHLPVLANAYATPAKGDGEGDGKDGAGPGASAPRVLVVDDNIPSAQTAGWMLEMLGYQAALAHDGLQALAMARETRPDVVLLDIGLPGMNGYDVCRAIKADPALRDTIVIAQTGWGQKRDRDMAMEAGFDCHLVKPVNLEEFTRILAGLRAGRG